MSMKIKYFILFFFALFSSYTSYSQCAACSACDSTLTGTYNGNVTWSGSDYYCIAVGAVIIRSAKKISLVPSAMIGKLMVTLIALLFVDQLKLEGNDNVIIPLMCIMCVAIPFVLVTLAPRYITAAEVNLFFLLETILGPLWVWLVIKEQPSFETIIGGVVIVATIGVHAYFSLKKNIVIN